MMEMTTQKTEAAPLSCETPWKGFNIELEKVVEDAPRATCRSIVIDYTDLRSNNRN